MVIAADPQTGRAGAREVTDLIVGAGRRDLVELKIDGEKIVATAGHPFWVVDDQGWIQASDLRVGDSVLLPSRARRTIQSTHQYPLSNARVHNLTVGDLHTYYVGWKSVLTHNCAPKAVAPRAIGPAGDPGATGLRISSQKQAGHVPGTPQNANRLKHGVPTSVWRPGATADALTRYAWQHGRPVPGRSNVREFDFGFPVGSGPGGGGQSRVRVHMDAQGQIHGHPSGPESTS